MAMIWVDGVEIKTPSTFTWGIQDVSDAAAGRTLDAVMHKNRIARKRKLSFTWTAPTPGEAAEILAAFDPEYVNITYPDTRTGKNETRIFYTGDITSPMKIWTIGHKRYEVLSFDVTER
ncbi:DUF6711 family protein [Lachnospiraceae bacterium 42-17]|jgi:hypothetical protein